jgi:undecaprenyl diphosphate synthase
MNIADRLFGLPYFGRNEPELYSQDFDLAIKRVIATSAIKLYANAMPKPQWSTEQVPPNTLVLPDGNRRWAKLNGTSYEEAYELGARRIVSCTRHLGMLGTRQLWFGIARPFNFERTESEVRAVLDACLKIHDIGQEDGEPFNITVGGNLGLMPMAYLQKFKAQESLHDPDGVTAHLLIGWSTETELESFRRRALDYPTETVGELLLRSSAVVEPVDYLIRTGVSGQGGRVSGMIPPHSLEAELHFENTLFPDFTNAHLDAAFDDYVSRTHRNQLVL